MSHRIEPDAFGTSVKKHFAGLFALGYSLTSTEPDRVIISADELCIEISIEPGSYLVELELRRAVTGDRYNLYEILSAFAPSEADKIQCHASDAAALEKCLQRLSNACDRSLQPLLIGDEQAFVTVERTAREIRRKTTLEAQFGAVLENANEEWEQKNWSEAHELYEAAKPALSPTEKDV